MSDGSVRRLVSANDARGWRSHLVSDGPSPDIRGDPARRGFTSTRVWVTERTPVSVDGMLDTLDTPHTLEPPPSGSVCRVVTYPPEATWRDSVGRAEVQAFFAAMGSPGASRWGPEARHPYVQQTRTLDFCIVLEGEISLVLDLDEVDLRAGDTVVLRGSNHAWRNRSDKPCTLVITSHDGTE
jgi:mannose-6-phosphate isomerase-like protein (cupin superfamily)